MDPFLAAPDEWDKGQARNIVHNLCSDRASIVIDEKGTGKVGKNQPDFIGSIYPIVRLKMSSSHAVLRLLSLNSLNGLL